MNSPDISILIPIGPFRERQFRISMQSLVRPAYDIRRIELLTFVDYSNPTKIISTLRHFSSSFSSIRLFVVQNKRNRIMHSATRRNYLATKARGKYILFSEPEMFHLNDTIPLLLRKTEKNKKLEWLCGPVYATKTMVNNEGSFILDEYRVKENTSHILDLITFSEGKINLHKSKPYFVKINEKEYAHLFFCTMLHREFFLSLGGLNQHLLVRGWEEIEFFQRFREHHGYISFHPEFITYHLPHKRTTSLIQQVAWNLYNSTILFDPTQSIGKLSEDIKEISLP